MQNKDNYSFWSKTIVVCIGALICCALWGSAFPCIKIGCSLFNISSDSTGSQILFAGCRFTLAGIFALIIGSFIYKKALVPQKKSWSKILLLSTYQTIGQYIFFYIGLAHCSGVKASIIEAVNVFVAILVASLIFHQEKLTSRKIIGSIIGFSGVILVNLSGNSIDFSFKFIGEGFIVLSTICYAFSSVCLKKYSKEENPIVLSGYQFILGGIILIIIGIIMKGHFEQINTKGLLMLLYLALLSAIAYSLWGILIKYNPISKVAVFGFMNPVFGVILSAVFLDESNFIGLSCVISLILVCIGIYIVNLGPKEDK